MNYKDFTIATITEMDQPVFELLKTALIGEYLSFSVIPETDITQNILAEKICSYFETLEIKTGKTFDKYIERYINDLDSIVSNKVAKIPDVKKDAPAPAVPRARKYYDKALEAKNSRNLLVRQLLDYSRIMMCLYMAIINNGFKEIDNLDYSVDCLDPGKIISAMKNEKSSNIIGPIGRSRARFNTKDLYSSDTSTFIISIILLYRIMNDKVQGEYTHE